MGPHDHQPVPVEHVSSLLAASPDSAAVVRLANEEVTIVGGNERFARLCGRSLEDLMRRRLETAVGEEIAEAVRVLLSADGAEPTIVADVNEAIVVNDATVTIRLTPTEPVSHQRLGLLTAQIIPPPTSAGLHEQILERITVPVIVAGDDHAITYANEAAAHMLGRTVGALVGTDVRRVATADDWSRLARHLGDPSAEPAMIEVDHRSGQRRVARVCVERVDDLLAITLEDRTGETAQEEHIAELHTLDPLTGLANRAGLAGHMNKLVDQDDGRILTVAFLDLDNFKTINDALGHDQGDTVLEVIGGRLSEAVGSFGLVARLGGDEFVVACSVSPESDSGELEHLVAQPFAEPVSLGDRELKITASVGIAQAGAGDDGDSVLKAADLAMYEAKRRGKNTVAIYDSSLEHRASERLEIESDLRRGLDNGELTVHYQPIVDVMTGRPTGAEALVRWFHPQRGPIPPSRFIPIAEQTGLIGPIGELVLETAVAQMASWNRDQLARKPMSISVNLSGVQLIDPKLERRIEAALSRSGLDPARLTIEITESTLMAEAGATLSNLARFSEAGITIAIDDFGTGYSSLAYLKRLPADVLKIDKEFIDGLGSTPEDTALVTGIVGLASALGMRIVAEGVEHERQLRELRRLGCEGSQGYLHCKPLPAEEFEDWVRACYEPVAVVDDGSTVAGLGTDIESFSDPIAPPAMARHGHAITP